MTRTEELARAFVELAHAEDDARKATRALNLAQREAAAYVERHEFHNTGNAVTPRTRSQHVRLTILHDALVEARAANTEAQARLKEARKATQPIAD